MSAFRDCMFSKDTLVTMATAIHGNPIRYDRLGTHYGQSCDIS